jgi:hypothetical protein
LPGFSVDTTGIVDVKDDNDQPENVLTNKEGQIVLAVRVSSSGYQGIHFIVVERSALSEFGLSQDASGKYVENSTATDGTPTSSQYYTTYLPDSENYPTTADKKTKLATYVNYNNPTSEDLTTRSGNISTALKGFNTSLSTYQFQLLVEKKQVDFSSSTTAKNILADIEKYSTIKRQSADTTAYNTWCDNWKSYADLLAQQEAARGVKDSAGKDLDPDGLNGLLCEYTAVHYTDSTKDALWDKNGACYYGTK